MSKKNLSPKEMEMARKEMAELMKKYGMSADMLTPNAVVEKVVEETPRDNVKMTVKGNKLTIEIDLSKDFGISKSGKSVIIASTEGNIAVKDNIKIGLNLYKPAK